MSRVIVIPPAINLSDEVLLHLKSEKHDYSGNIVVFPGKRPAHFLRKVIAEAEGQGFIPPQLFSIDTFIDFLHERISGKTPRNLPNFDAATLLYDIHRKLENTIGEKKFEEFDAFLPLGLRVFGEFEEVMMTDEKEEKVEAALFGIPLRGIHVLGKLYPLFYKEVRDTGFSTRAMRYAETARGFNKDLLGEYGQIVLAGFYAFTGTEQRLLDQLVALDKTTVIFQEGPGVAERLKTIPVTAEYKDAVKEERSISCYAAPDIHGEVFGLAAKIEEGLKAGRTFDQKTVIVVPDPSALPSLVHHALALLPNDYNISIGYPHGRTTVLGFLTVLMDLISARFEDKFRAVEYIKFILHPYTKNVFFSNRPDITRVLFHVTEEEFLKGNLKAFFTLDDVEGFGSIFERTASIVGEKEITPAALSDHLGSIHRNTISRLVDVHTVGDAAEQCIGILTYVSSNSTARQHPFFRLYAESLMDSLGQIIRSRMAGREFSDSGMVLRIIRGFLQQGRVALPGTPLQGLQVLGLLETRNLQFDRVYVLNANDDLLPGSSNRYSLIPSIVRQNLGLPTYRDQDKIQEYYLHLLVEGSKEVSFFYTENGSRDASRFVEQVLWSREKETGKVSRESLVATVPYRTKLSHAKPLPIPKPEGIGAFLSQMKFSASSLDTYLKCGLRFYYRYVLKLYEREDVDADVDRRDHGDFVHRVLTDFYAPFVGKTLDPEKVGQRDIRGVVEKTFEKMFGKEQLGNQYLMKKQTGDHLMEFLTAYEIPRLREQPVELLGVEEDVVVSRDGFQLIGRLDRVERRGGIIVIHDYKTTGNPGKLRIRPEKLLIENRASWRDAIGSLQLPFYALLYGEGHGEEADRIRPAYVVLGKTEMNREIEIPLYQEKVVPENLYPVLEQIISGLLSEIGDEQKAFDPTQDLEENCPQCPYVHLCGTKWVKRNYL